jgi:hypothetical protein
MVSMAPVLNTRKLDGGASNHDALGIFYVVVAILYTIVLAAELYLLHRYRSVFCVRIRNLKVVFPAICMLHIYLVLVLLVYPWNGLFPCAAEFWIMSVFLPMGMALFQGRRTTATFCFSLTSRSMQCQGAYSIRKPAPAQAQLLGRCSQEAPHIHPSRLVAGMEGSRRSIQGLLWHHSRLRDHCQSPSNCH